VTTELHLDRTTTFPAGRFCPFAFTADTVGTFRETVYSDGKDVTHAVDFHITYTNPANGKSLTTVLGGPFVVEPNGAGTVTVTIDGSEAPPTEPGQWPISPDVGKPVYLAAPSHPPPPLTTLKPPGQQAPSQFPAPCDGLS